MQCNLYERGGKRSVDFLLSSTLALLLSPVLVTLAIAVWVKLGNPVLFRQQRPGKNGKLFTMVKFRTMTDAQDETGRLLPDVDRLTSFGTWLRSTSLDELPELWNVIVGEMSLVGPRPLLVEYMKLYSGRQSRRHQVRPGMTGWAQVHGRNAINWNERFEMDLWYVDHSSFFLDIGILMRTLKSVVRREGISAEGDATMPPFLG